MNTNIKRGIVTGAISLSLLGGSAAGVVAQNEGNQGNQGGAAGLVAAVVQLNDTNVDVIEVSDSLNNLRALNNVLNNSPILNGLDITVTDVVEVGNITVDIEDVLNDNNVNIDDVIGVAVLSNGDLVILT